MTSMILSQSTQDAINRAIAEGPGANNQNYLAAYSAIYADISAHGGFNSGALNWFSQAGLVNTQAFSPNASGTYIWAYTKAAAATQGVNISDSDIQSASNKIADAVFHQLSDIGFSFSDNPGDRNNFAPTSIIRDDAGAGLAELSALHPGSNLDYAIWEALCLPARSSRIRLIFPITASI